MGLFGFGKKKADNAPVCACQSAFPAADKTAKIPCGVSLSIKVLGAGCGSCHALLENTKKAAANAGLAADVEFVTDMTQIAGYGVMRIPALVVNEKVVAAGKVLNATEAEALLKRLAAPAADAATEAMRHPF